MKLFTATLITIITFITLPVTTEYDPDDYPTWEEVEQAREDENKTQQQVEKIEKTIKTLEENYQQAVLEAQQAGETYYEKQYEYDIAAWEHQQLTEAYETAAAEAETAKQTSNLILTEIVKTGTLDLQPMKIFLNPDNTGDLLAKIGYADKISTNMEHLFNDATLKQNTAESLAKQTETAKQLKETAAVEAETAYDEAQQKQTQAETAYTTQQEKIFELQTQLQALTEQRTLTETQYREGIEAKKAAEEEARRKAAETAAANANQTVPQTSNTGWAKPTTGYISSHYGWRVHPIYGTQRFHSGTDFANRCGTPMYAATSGTVEYAGWLGTLGNFIRINHGNGLTTGYGHIQNGGIKVTIGQQVQTGQYIADMGTTGGSTGCHLHFEIRNNKAPTDPFQHLKNQGVSF